MLKEFPRLRRKTPCRELAPFDSKKERKREREKTWVFSAGKKFPRFLGTQTRFSAVSGCPGGVARCQAGGTGPKWSPGPLAPPPGRLEGRQRRRKVNIWTGTGNIFSLFSHSHSERVSLNIASIVGWLAYYYTWGGAAAAGLTPPQISADPPPPPPPLSSSLLDFLISLNRLDRLSRLNETRLCSAQNPSFHRKLFESIPPARPFHSFGASKSIKRRFWNT